MSTQLGSRSQALNIRWKNQLQNVPSLLHEPLQNDVSVCARSVRKEVYVETLSGRVGWLHVRVDLIIIRRIETLSRHFFHS